MTFEEKTMHCAIGIGALEQIRYAEKKVNPKSARSMALDNLIDNAERVITFYKMNDWSAENLDIASKCLAIFETTINRKFYPKLVARDKKGRFRRAIK